ncbi:hypothetical protein AAFF_G00028690 [Aldrovandia affinis]|uniref:Uncharacterized protein n=1 Tax=Aldrovandia affinis TaxID=143900 RepID=A0AAD7S4J3_9TELE|nr:hypothetical protein AAFF_G00028690 [Aldrovandia affinis]
MSQSFLQWLSSDRALRSSCQCRGMLGTAVLLGVLAGVGASPPPRRSAGPISPELITDMMEQRERSVLLPFTQKGIVPQIFLRKVQTGGTAH